jgi:hypothetical protein
LKKVEIKREKSEKGLIVNKEKGKNKITNS